MKKHIGGNKPAMCFFFNKRLTENGIMRMIREDENVVFNMLKFQKTDV